jgi:hypothetical protein
MSGNSPKDLPCSIREYIGDLYQESPDAIVSEIKAELNYLINEIVNSKTKDLYFLGRKAQHLFHPSIDRLLEKHFSIKMLNVLNGEINGKHICIVDHGGPMPKKISLLADSVNDGTEKANIISILKRNKTEVKNLFCYVGNRQGLDYLVKQKIIAADRITALHILETDEYKVFSKRLHTYYQSKIEPIDTDHKFEYFSVARKISPEKLYGAFQSTIKKTLPCESGEFSIAERLDDADKQSNLLFMPKETVNFNYECYDHNEYSKLVGTNSKIEDLEIEYVQVRLKAELKDTESVVYLMVFCPPINVDLTTVTKGKCKMGKNGCMLENSYDSTRFKKGDVAKLLCPQCIENQISTPVLNNIANELKALLDSC